ncbi:hypothetical protein DIZ81_00085 [Legionella taurinensis]|uniref:Periplasmic protein n=1 Tax=Legionella taurinensis TaxID=70611 RepID=A0A3A5L0S7_9GAMM|nr:hypothetical protein [Legionella taurinensis]MDX1836728.1 hypothetical protein [Legionella taurinensis]PUT42819.1 hypothetical protein DB744_00085 [Legionella taurinensis]PUT45374.1 hypothetical protein DB746_00085 [Legionella taurinensis]PUT47051.1 hypothetical protein DB743_03915 [Legionella taurinensis]PUT49141.1 hypothetical protein DB745_00085 [Legionella taurinensis]
MAIRCISTVSGMLFCVNAFAFPCFITLAKDNCWTNYNVKVVVTDGITNEEITTVIIPKGQSWARESFNCQPAQKFMYRASFTPVIWEKDAHKVYRAQRFWSMPGSIEPGTTAWNIPVCFTSDFSETPYPPDATGKCVCDFSTIPPVSPQ